LKLSLAMIVLNAEDNIQRAIASARGCYDELVVVDTGSTDRTKEAILEVEPEAIILDHVPEERHPDHGWLCDFSAARNQSFDACTGDVILWLDADDTIENKDGVDPALAMREMAEDYFFERDIEVDIMNVRYDYEKDRFGNVTVSQPRYRVVRKDCFEWIYPVHEDLKPLRHLQMADVCQGPTYIDHHIVGGGEIASAERNLWIMERYEANGGEMNERMWANYGGAYKSLGRHEEATEAFEKGIAMCTNNDEALFIMLMRCGDSYRAAKDPRNAARIYMQGMSLMPKRKQPYLCMAELMSELEHPEEAVHWADVADATPETSEGAIWLPNSALSVPLLVRAKAYMQTSRYYEALDAYKGLLEIYPDHPQYLEMRDLVAGMIADHKTYESAQIVASVAQDPTPLAILPERFRTFPDVARCIRPERPSGRLTAVIFCGSSNSAWGPKSLSGGLGGSEEAVVLLSRELVKCGVHVEVYAFPGAHEVGTDEDGVVWMPYNAYDPEEPVDVFIGWRQFRNQSPMAQGIAKSAAQRYLWLHDIVIVEWFRNKWMDSLDGIFCLTDFHKKPIPERLQDKVVMTKNGLDPAFFVDGKNGHNRFIYASSPDRGLVCLLEEWPKIRAALPDATLDIYYGFTKQYLAEMEIAPHLKVIKEQVDELIKQDGVFWHGMVGHMELAHAFAASGFWLYPTSWPETSCITSMKAQAMGAIPITSRYKDSGVPETTKYDLGPKARDGMIHENAKWRAAWTASVIKAAQRDDLDETRQEMKAWARQTYSWESVAQQWAAMFIQRSAQSSEQCGLPSPSEQTPEPAQT